MSLSARGLSLELSDIPVLGDIPLIGKVARKKVELHLKKYVYFFATAQTIDGPMGEIEDNPVQVKSNRKIGE